MKREIQPGSDAPRGHEVAVIDHTGVDEVGPRLFEFLACARVRRRRPAVGYPGASQQHPTGTDRREIDARLLEVGDRRREVAPFGFGPRAGLPAGPPPAARHYDQVGVEVGQPVVDADRGPVAGGDPVGGVERTERDVEIRTRLSGVVEDLEGGDSVEFVDAIEGDDRDLYGSGLDANSRS